MNAHNAELWQTILTIGMSFLIGVLITFCIFVTIYVIIFIVLRFIQLFTKETAKKVDASKEAHADSHQIRNEWGYVQLNTADEMVMSTMGELAKLDYVTNKINIFRGSATPIEILVEDGPSILNRSRIQWREV